MPVISKFYGIVIRMMFIQPFGAHFHAFYENSELVVGIDPLRIIQGTAPRRMRVMVMEWAASHHQELAEAWGQMRAAKQPATIAPLT